MLNQSQILKQMKVEWTVFQSNDRLQLSSWDGEVRQQLPGKGDNMLQLVNNHGLLFGLKPRNETVQAISLVGLSCVLFGGWVLHLLSLGPQIHLFSE